MRGWFILAALVLLSRINGYESWDCPCQSCWCGSTAVVGEFLWWQPTGCDALYVLLDGRQAVSSALPSGVGRQGGVARAPGFRIGLGYLYEGRRDEFFLSFTGLWSDGDRSTYPLGNAGIWLVLGHPRYLTQRLNNPIEGVGVPASARARFHLGYEAVTGAFARRWPLSCDAWIRGAVGVHWARLRDRLDLHYSGTARFNEGTPQEALQEQTHFIRHRYETEGAGPCTEVEGSWHLGCGFGLGARVGMAILLGQRKLRFMQSSQGNTLPSPGPHDFSEELTLNQRMNCVLFPQLTARLLLTYRHCCGRCHAFLFGIGYEWLSYFNGIRSYRFNDRAGTQSIDCHNVNFSGLTLSITLLL